MTVVINNPVSLRTGGGTSVSFSYTCGAGSNKYLIGFLRDAAGFGLSNVTYAGVAMTVLSTVGSSKTFGLVAPASGANTFAATISSYDGAGIDVSAANFSGVDQTTPVGAGATATGSSAAPATGSITMPSGGAVWGAVHHLYTTAFTAGSGTTIQSQKFAGAQGQADGTRSTTGALAWTATASATWEAAGYPINAASGGLLLPTLSSVTYTPGTLTSSGYGVRVTAA